MSHRPSFIVHRRWLTISILVLLLSTLLACAGTGVAVNQRAPRWACPSPVPAAHGASGPVKTTIRHTRAPEDGGDWEENVYYEQWEQEYGPNGTLLAGAPPFGAPFPSPTPYAIEGATYTLGQRVEVAPLHVQLTANAGPLIGAEQLYWFRFTWHNPTSAPVPVDYLRQPVLSAIIAADNTQRPGNWTTTPAALKAADISQIPVSIPVGESQFALPILAPPGRPQAAAFRFALLESTPMPNSTPRTLTVHWVANAITIGPACTTAGATTEWSGTGWGQPVTIDLQAPPGSGRLVELLMAQQGKPYVWGATGPNAFDCSGLAVWAYAQIGVGGIPRTTYGQWPELPAVAPNAALAGDLIFFDTYSDISRIQPHDPSHVGVLVGDVNGDGRMDMVHAASPKYGIVLVSDVFNNSYYAPRYMGLRRVPGWKERS